MIGRTIHHYQITEKLGEGGMGVVYRAEDTRLHRTVALKFLHPALLSTPEDQQRLVAEARAAAGLAHPNICTIYEINEIDDKTFIAMQYVEGSTLRDRVLSGRIETADALRYLLQIADGLRQAHEKGIVHRDMKSSNIMITNTGRAVIMDFGLARPVEQGRVDERFTSRGTSAYMSPEQARGESVDQRTDIWSMGVVLYEMLAGQLPFRGDYEQAVIYSILNEGHRPIAEFRPGLPSAVVKIVETCLEKRREDRYQTLDELIAALRGALDDLTGVRRRAPRRVRVAGVAALTALTLVAAFVAFDFLRARHAEGEVRVPIAVIDFDNDTDEPALDGLSGMLITALEQSRRLSVMTRSRMFDILKTLGHGDATGIDESLGQRICEASGVDALVIPTIRRFGNLYTIDLKIMNTRTHKYVYTTKREARGQENIPEMIDAIARDIRIDLREATDTVARTESVADVTTPNLDAYQAYFEGEALLNDLNFARAGQAFNRAIADDSTFALAYYRLAYTEWWSRGSRAETQRHIAYAIDHLDRIPLKERFLVRALKAGLDDGFEAQIPIYKEMRVLYPDDKEMLFGLGDAEFHAARYDSAAVHFRAVLAVDPGMDRALQHLTWTYMRLDRFDEALKTAEQWVEKAPSAEAYEYLATAHLHLGQAEDAMKILEAVEKRYPDDPHIPIRMSVIRFAMGHPHEALALAKKAQSLSANADISARFELGGQFTMLYAYFGRYKDAMKVLDLGSATTSGSLEDSTVVSAFAATRAGLLYWAHGDPMRSLDELKSVPATWVSSPRHKNADYWRGVATFYILAGDTAQANRILEAHGKDFPPDKLTFVRIIERAESRDCAGAVELARTLPASTGGFDALGDIASYCIGSCQLQSGDYEGAIRSFRSVTERPLLNPEVAPAYAMVWLRLGIAYEEKGATSDAAACYRHVLEMLKDGDPDLASRRDARTRLDRLTATGTM